MAIAYLGVSSVIDASGGDGSVSTETIPAGATLAVIMSMYWDTTSGNLASVTIDGQAAATPDQAAARSGDDSGYYLARCSGFSTGTNKTISWTWTNNEAISEGGGIFITYWSGADTSAFADSGADSQGTSPTTSPSVSLTSSTGQVIVAMCESFGSGSTPDLAVTGGPTITSVYNDATNGGNNHDIDYFTRNTTPHVLTMTGQSYSVILGAVLQEPAAGGGTTIIVPTGPWR